jgi:lipopolysaccharide/colanic/teichoic acid biosynthesis glycosyltransferase
VTELKDVQVAAIQLLLLLLLMTMMMTIVHFSGRGPRVLSRRMFPAHGSEIWFLRFHPEPQQHFYSKVNQCHFCKFFFYHLDKLSAKS